MKQKVFSIIGILLLTLGGFSAYSEFMTNHTYYNGMFTTWANRNTIIWALISTMIPIAYIIRSKKFSLKTFALKMIPMGLGLFIISTTLIKETIFGPTGLITLLINTAIIYALGMYFILGTLALGSRISKQRIRLSQNRIQEMFINFGIGIGAFLLLVRLLLIADCFFGGVVRALFIGLGVAIYFSTKTLSGYRTLLEEEFSAFQENKLNANPFKWIGIVLIGLSIIYYFYGTNLSYIPYSTAWDANHEYMYIPKILAENHGILRGNNGPGAVVPFLRHGFITFWFGLGNTMSKFRIGPDTIAVAMNFLSGVLTLIFGIATIKEIISFFTTSANNNESKEEKNSETETSKEGNEIGFYLGRSLLILWLTSGMGAFLVFVDNKTDLGVMAITMLAILSGCIFLNQMRNQTHDQKKLNKESVKYIIISGVFFALASMAKPTAFIDIALFGLLFIGLRVNSIISIGLGISIMGITGIMKVANAPDLLNPTTGKRFFIVGAIIAIVGITKAALNKKEEIARIKTHLKYLGIWAISLIGMLVIFKGPTLVYSQIQDHSFSPSNFAKSLLLAQTTSGTEVMQQTAIDQAAVTQTTQEGLAACKTITYTKEELEKTIKKAVVGNEDVGRYVGYGQREITKTNGINLGYGFLRLLFRSDNTCYGLNSDAKVLCRNSQAIENFDIKTLKSIDLLTSPTGKAHELISGAIAAFTKKGYTETSKYNPTEFRDNIVSLRQYYQSHSIQTQEGKIMIPYRYMIPLNVIFNRSLQNLSSYYTDIGFIWIFMLAFIIIGCAYGIATKNKKLITITTTSMLGWGIRWIIGGGILRYGMGLIIWTILAASLFIKDLFEASEHEDKENNKNSNEIKKNLFLIMIFLLGIWIVLQLFFNLIRISSQGGSGPFLWYKMNIGKTIELDDSLQQKEVEKNGYKRKDVFDLQFPYYNKFIEAVADRKNEDGVMIAGTYIQYFLKNQRNIKGDGMLSWLWEQASDNDSCKAYQRIKNANIKYLVIDPNIGTVGMGEGNETLFQRFYAKLDPVTGKIKDHGAISMLAKLYKDGYLDLFSTNNIGSKYAFIVSDEALRASFGQTLTADDLIQLRAKMSIARYFQDINQMADFFVKTFEQRLVSGDAISDIADIYGKIINEAKLKAAAQTILAGGQVNADSIKTLVTPLTQDERLVLSQYLGVVNMKKVGGDQYQQTLQNILGQSLGGSSQLIIFSLK